LAIIDAVDDAFKAWPKIRNHRFTQDYLFSFFGDPKGDNRLLSRATRD
jgi:hypothetical protein